MHLLSETSDQISLIVSAWYEESQSDLRLARYPFSFTVVIKNDRPEEVRIARRTWMIHEKGYQARMIEGSGVGGSIPVIPPGQALQYQITVPFQAATVQLKGTYVLTGLDSGALFYLKTPRFTLAAHIFN